MPAAPAAAAASTLLSGAAAEMLRVASASDVRDRASALRALRDAADGLLRGGSEEGGPGGRVRSPTPPGFPKWQP